YDKTVYISDKITEIWFSEGGIVEKNILIVDDEPLILIALSAVFRRENMTVKAVALGREALKELQDNRFALCFIDIHLPDMNGLDVMRAVKAASPATTIVIMTGGEVDNKMLASIQQCASLLIAKPFDLDRITSFTARVLSREAQPLSAGSDHSLPAPREPFANWLEEDRRRHGRYASPHAISCVPAGGDGGKEGGFAASVIDISATGMGIQTDCPLKPGYFLEFSGLALYGRGIVCWSMNLGEKAAWRSGVRFVDPEYA
ncbi:MAG TPA: response regulator, partial [Nitrospirota bacterium]